MHNPLRSILMLADTSARTAARLVLARELAERHDGEVTALFAATPLQAEGSRPFGEVAGAMVGAGALDPRQRARERLLDELTGGSELPRVRWAEVVREPVLEAVVRHAWCCDLVVMGQHDAAAAVHDLPAGFIASVLIDSGKPGLVLPAHGEMASQPGCVLVAWKPARESARAVAAALPWLREAREVHVACWSRTPVTGAAGGMDIEGYLRTHGIAPVIHARGPEPRHVGEALLDLAGTLGAQLLVMGCYGHGRLREQVLGEATRTLLRSAGLPLLMVH